MSVYRVNVVVGNRFVLFASDDDAVVGEEQFGVIFGLDIFDDVGIFQLIVLIW